MDKDRTQICNILSRMLDNPNQHEIYPTSTAFTELELYIERVRFEALGWCYAYCCVLLDSGKDPRTELVPELIVNANMDLAK